MAAYSDRLAFRHGGSKMLEVLQPRPTVVVMAAGECKTSECSSYQLFLFEAGFDGELVWFRECGGAVTVEVGYDVVPLPEGGYCSTGIKDGSPMGELILLRSLF